MPHRRIAASPHRRIELIVFRTHAVYSFPVPDPAKEVLTSYVSRTVQARDVTDVSGSDGSAALRLRDRAQPHDWTFLESLWLTQARLHWVMTAKGAPQLDDPVACPSLALALAMAKAGAHSKGWTPEQVLAAIEPWFTKEEIHFIQTGQGSTPNAAQELSAIVHQLAAIKEAISRRDEERSLLSEGGLGGRINARREEAVLAAGAKPASRTASR